MRDRLRAVALSLLAAVGLVAPESPGGWPAQGEVPNAPALPPGTVAPDLHLHLALPDWGIIDRDPSGQAILLQGSVDPAAANAPPTHVEVHLVGPATGRLLPPRNWINGVLQRFGVIPLEAEPGKLSVRNLLPIDRVGHFTGRIVWDETGPALYTMRPLRLTGASQNTSTGQPVPPTARQVGKFVSGGINVR